MTSRQLYDFMTKHNMTPETLAHLLDVTEGAVNHWLFDRRKVPPTTTKLLKFFERNPAAVVCF